MIKGGLVFRLEADLLSEVLEQSVGHITLSDGGIKAGDRLAGYDADGFG